MHNFHMQNYHYLKVQVFCLFFLHRKMCSRANYWTFKVKLKTPDKKSKLSTLR